MLSFIMRFERDPDRDRFAALYQMNHTRMERLARQLLGDQNRAEDAVHDTFMKLIRHYDELRDRSDERLASWLLVVVKTTALDMLRRDKWENACEELPEGQSVPAGGGEFRALVEIIRRMPEDYRRVLELRFVAEWSISDIARELGLTESAVRTRTFRGRKLLIDTLKKEGYLDERATV